MRCRPTVRPRRRHLRLRRRRPHRGRHRSRTGGTAGRADARSRYRRRAREPARSAAADRERGRARGHSRGFPRRRLRASRRARRLAAGIRAALRARRRTRAGPHRTRARCGGAGREAEGQASPCEQRDRATSTDKGAVVVTAATATIHRGEPMTAHRRHARIRAATRTVLAGPTRRSSVALAGRASRRTVPRLRRASAHGYVENVRGVLAVPARLDSHLLRTRRVSGPTGGINVIHQLADGDRQRQGESPTHEADLSRDCRCAP